MPTETETETAYTLCVRRWFDKANGNSYYSMRIIGKGQDITVPITYGHGDAAPIHHACSLLAIDWVTMEWEQRRDVFSGVFSIDDVTVSRRKDLHNGGKTQ